MTGALRSMAALTTSPAAIVPLLSHGLAVYQVDLDALQRLRPDVVLTQVQDMAPEDRDDAAGPGPHSQRVARAEAALALLWGYQPKLVHLAANNLQECWADMTAIADAMGISDKGRRCVASLQQQMEWVRDACRGRAKPEVVCVQWLDPWYVYDNAKNKAPAVTFALSCRYTGGSWVPECLEVAGGRPLLSAAGLSMMPFYLPQLAASGAQVLVFAICGLDLQTSMQHVRGVLQQLVAQCGDLPAVRCVLWRCEACTSPTCWFHTETCALRWWTVLKFFRGLGHCWCRACRCLLRSYTTGMGSKRMGTAANCGNF